MQVSIGAGSPRTARTSRTLGDERGLSGPGPTPPGRWPRRRRRRVAAIAPMALLAVLVVGAAVGVGRSDPPARAQSGQADVGSAAAGPGTTLNAGSGPVEYGLAEPAGSLPGSDTPGDRAAWSQIRSDVLGSGSCWLRSDLDTWLTRAIDAFDWLGSPAACSDAAGSPIKVLAILDDQTVWAAQRLCPDTVFSSAYWAHRSDFTLDDWRSLVRCVARRYVGRISAYEIWNEPVLPESMFGYQDGSAAHYFDLLRIGDTEIKAADPSATVIALGGSDLYTGGDQSRLDLMHSVTTQLIALGAPRYADAISLHAYPWGRHDAPVWSSYEAELRFQEQAWGKPVWITETGQRASDGWTQAAYLEAAYGLFVRAGVRHIFWFSITDQPDGDFGLRGRPVEAAMRAFALAHLWDDAPDLTPYVPGAGS